MIITCMNLFSILSNRYRYNRNHVRNMITWKNEKIRTKVHKTLMYIKNVCVILRASVLLDHYEGNVVFFHYLDVSCFLCCSYQLSNFRSKYYFLRTFSIKICFSQLNSFCLTHTFAYKGILFADILKCLFDD